jgi:hypothetical protein
MTISAEGQEDVVRLCRHHFALEGAPTENRTMDCRSAFRRDDNIHQWSRRRGALICVHHFAPEGAPTEIRTRVVGAPLGAMDISAKGQENAVRLCRHQFAPEGALSKIEPGL